MNYAVEEDGDEIFTPMPKICTKWPCYKAKARVRKEGRYMRCERCGASYGEAQPAKKGKTP